MKKVSEATVDLNQRHRAIAAEKMALAVLEVYQNRKESLPPELIEDAEKYLIGVWDVKTTKIKLRDRTKKRKTQ